MPVEIARIICDKVAAGEYATESEVVGDSLLRLVERDKALDDWLDSEVVPAYDRLRADPDSAITIEDVREAIAAEQAGSAQHWCRFSSFLPRKRKTSSLCSSLHRF